jgi:hypothetical protein
MERVGREDGRVGKAVVGGRKVARGMERVAVWGGGVRSAVRKG